MEDTAKTYTVQWARRETPQMKLISLSGNDLWSYIPGQVAVLGVEGIGESYYALASAPEDKTGMEFLVKNGEGVSKALYEATEGTKIQAKGPVGKGFPIDQYKGRDLLIVAVGSAMAPMRGVIKSICRRRQDFGKISVIFGARTPEDFPFLGEVDDCVRRHVQHCVAEDAARLSRGVRLVLRPRLGPEELEEWRPRGRPVLLGLHVAHRP